MDDAKIKNFLVLSNCLNYTKAASEIGKSQSVLSRQIASMEEEMGVILFSRTTKEVVLTEAGKVAKQWFETLQSQYEIMLTEAKAAQEGYKGILRFGAMAGLKININYSKIINAFMVKYPDIKIQLEAENPDKISEKLMDGRLDYVMGAAEEYSNIRDFKIIVAGKARNGLAIPSTHPKAGIPDEDLSIEDFVEDTWIVFAVAPMAQKELMKKIEGLGVALNIIEVKDVASIAMWLQSNAGVAPLSETHAITDPSIVIKYIKDLGNIEEAFIRNKYSDNPCVSVFEKFVNGYLKSK